MNTYFKKSTKRSVISMLSIAITLCLLFSLLFPGKAVNATPTIINKKPYRLLILSKRAVFADTLARWVTFWVRSFYVTAVQTPYYHPAL